jgi:hypothetical protein
MHAKLNALYELLKTKKSRNFRFGFLCVLKMGLEPIRAFLPTGF